MNDLFRKLRESGLIKQPGNLQPMDTNSKVPIEEVFVGDWDYRLHGDVFIIRNLLEYGTAHGKMQIADDIDPQPVFSLENIDQSADFDNHSMVFFDIETSNLSFGAGSFVFLIGCCYFKKEGLETILFLIDDPGSEKALLERFNEEISRFEIICSYNGKSFDAPFLSRRLSFHHVDNLFKKRYHIDLLHHSRRLWKLRLNSCRLSDIEQRILCVERKEIEIPGWLVPQMYFDYLNTKDPAMLEGILYHNTIDVISLAMLFQHVASLMYEIIPKAKLDSRDYFSLGKIYEKKRDFGTAVKWYKIADDNIPKGQAPQNFYFYYGICLKKTGKLDQAIATWLVGADNNEYLSCIELSKYFEHTVKNYEEALAWANTGKNVLSIDSDQKTRVISKVDHRIHRLTKRRKNEK